MDQIKRSVREGATIYLANNESHVEALLEVVTPRMAKRLLETDAVSGPSFEAIAVKLEEDAAEEKRLSNNTLPSGFPGRLVLTTHGIRTIDQVRAATDEELLALVHTEQVLAAIRQAVA